MAKMCVCRNCGKKYVEAKSRAYYRGYCNNICMYAKAKSLGWSADKAKRAKPGDGTRFSDVLRKAGQLGSVYVEEAPKIV